MMTLTKVIKNTLKTKTTKKQLGEDCLLATRGWPSRATPGLGACSAGAEKVGAVPWVAWIGRQGVAKVGARSRWGVPGCSLPEFEAS